MRPPVLKTCLLFIPPTSHASFSAAKRPLQVRRGGGSKQHTRRHPTQPSTLPPCLPLFLLQVSDPSKYGVVVMDDDMKVERFVEKPQVCAACILSGFWV